MKKSLYFTVLSTALLALYAGCQKSKSLPDYYHLSFLSPGGEEVKLARYADHPFILLFRDADCTDCEEAVKQWNQLRIVTVYTSNPDSVIADSIVDSDLKLAQILKVEATPAVCFMRAETEPVCYHDLSKETIENIQNTMNEV